MIDDNTIEIVRNELKNASANFNRTKLYKMLKEELTILDHWKAKGRGNPMKAYKASLNSKEQQPKNYSDFD